ncbi:MAG: DUF5683 domain-containing protein [Flavobacteriaceae bacterium]|nr:DUF5683 domain-containing protein [Flavobacteriaceae bacterium]
MKAKQLGLLLFLLLCIPIFAQEEEPSDFIAPDSLKINPKYSPRIQRLINDPLTPSKAAFYSAVVPGLGQAYLGKAWKVPIIYAAIGASLYYYDQNNKIMNSYRTAYKRRLNGFFDDEFLEKAIPIETEQLLIGIEFHKNYRDIAIVLAAAAYMLNILEANVSAHLLQFNVSEDLSVTPNIIVDQEVRGIRLALKF